MHNNFAYSVLKGLSRRYGSNPYTRLKHSGNTQLFVAVLLSPQCTDVQVNKTTKVLFSRFLTLEDYAETNLKTLRTYLKGINYYKTKAKHLRAAARMIGREYHGTLPKTINELMKLPGVGRKVANVILSAVFGINEGIAVDTHVSVTSRRLGLTRSKNPLIIERDLMKTFQRKEWGRVSELLIELGRDTCKARNKECYRCVLKNICPSSDVRKRYR